VHQNCHAEKALYLGLSVYKINIFPKKTKISALSLDFLFMQNLGVILYETSPLYIEEYYYISKIDY
jgi:hypothetical protein